MSRLLDLDGYVTGELDGAAADALEESMFDSPDDPDLVFFDRVARHGASLVAHRTFDMGCTRAQLDELIAAGHVVQIIDAGAPSSELKTLQVSPDAEFIVTCMPLGRTDLERVDIEFYVVAHQVTKTIKDAYVDRKDGILYGLCERPLAELAFGAGPTITRVRQCDGDRAVIAEWYLTGTGSPATAK